MTKEELIKLKKQTELAQKFRANLRNYGKNYTTGYLTYNAVQEKDATNEAIANIDNSLSSLVINAAKYGIDLARILVDIDWDYFKTKDVIETAIIPGPDDPNFESFVTKRIYDYLLVQMRYCIDSYDLEDTEIIEDKLNLLSPVFIVKYSTFLKCLEERGYDIKSPSFDIFLKENVRALNFQIDFEPQVKRSREKRN